MTSKHTATFELTVEPTRHGNGYNSRVTLYGHEVWDWWTLHKPTEEELWGEFAYWLSTRATRSYDD